MIGKSPCRYCEERHIGCHDGCAAFITWKEKQLKVCEIAKQERLKAGPSAASAKRHTAWIKNHK